MAILYGTTADGESLPVQVNEFGQLVAQGVPGPPGPEGPQGPPGDGGDGPALAQGFFDPVWGSSSTGAAVYDYEQQYGFWCRYGPLVIISVRLRSTNDVVTEARGKLVVTGIPDEARCWAPLLAGYSGLNSSYFASLRGKASWDQAIFAYDAINHWFQVLDAPNSTMKWLNYSQLEGDSAEVNSVNFTYFGLASDSAPTVRERVDRLM